MSRIVTCAMAIVLAGNGLGATAAMSADSTKVDSVRSRIIPALGTSLLRPQTYDVLARDWKLTDARTLLQVLAERPGVFTQPLGESGQLAATSWFGMDQAMSLDGIPLYDPFTRRVNLSLVPLEFIHGIESLDDPGAVLTGVRWNLVSPQYASPKPITAIRFVQEPFETILSDGSFSQNIFRSTNLLFGFQRHTSAGRFNNASLDSWQMRGRIRWNISDKVNLSTTWRYERTNNGLNGGIDMLTSPTVFDEVRAVVRQHSQYQILYRNDLGLTALGRLLGDSTSLTRIAIAQTSYEREYRIFPDEYQSQNIQQFSRMTERRIVFDQAFDTGPALLNVHASGTRSVVDSTSVYRQDVFSATDVGLSARLTVIPGITPSVSVGSHRAWGTQRPSSAVGITADLPAGFQVGASAAREPQSLSPTEFLRRDTTFLNAFGPPADHRIARLSFGWSRDSATEFLISPYRTQIANGTLFFHSTNLFGTEIIEARRLSWTWKGMAASVRMAVWKLHMAAVLTTARSEAPDSIRQLLPTYWGMAELSYQDQLFKNQLGVRFSVRTRFANRFFGRSPDAASGIDVVEQKVILGRAATIDIMAGLHIGDADVTLGWENLTDVPYLRSAVYPMPGRTFKLGVRWEFQN